MDKNIIHIDNLVVFSCVVFLTLFGLASIGLSCLMALFLYHVVFGVRYLGILNGVAAFVIIGIGKIKDTSYTLILFALKAVMGNMLLFNSCRDSPPCIVDMRLKLADS